MLDDRLPHESLGRMSIEGSPILSSRQPTFDQLAKDWTNRRAGQAVLTGATGAGKSWLWRKAAEHARGLRDDLRWIWVPQLPRSSGAELLRSLLTAVELSEADRSLTIDRVSTRLDRRLSELHEDGFRMVIVIEEAHHLHRDGYEMLRILRERLSTRGIEVSVLFVGQTSLIHRFRRISREPISHGWHLKYVTLPETLELLRWFGSSQRAWTRAEADWIHREALGNPRRILRWAETLQPLPSETDKPTIKPGQGQEPSGLSRPASESTMWAEPLIPTRPPLNESEGFIEVGYEGEDELHSNTMSIDSEDVSGRPSGSDIDTLESTEHRPSVVRYRFESAESFAPYGLGTARSETTMDSDLES
jgi:type II secretory pathway predicted ATPase ExeA